MDWGRVKIYLIIMFIALNGFLLYNIISIRMEDTASKETLANTAKILNSRGIKITEGQIPSFNPQSVMLSYDVVTLDKLSIAKALLGNGNVKADSIKEGIVTAGDKKLTFENGNSFVFEDGAEDKTVKASSTEEIKEELEKKLKEQGSDIKKFEPDSETVNEDGTKTVEFIEKYENYQIFDNKMTVTFGKEGVNEICFKYNKVTGIKKLPANSKKPLPAYQVLLNNFVKGRNATITEITLGFKGAASGNGSKSGLINPVWRIKIEDGNSEFYNAYTGETLN